MSKSLTLAAAMAPFCVLAIGQAADAQTTISNGTTTAVATATASNGGPGDVTLASGGSITLTTPGPALTLNSNNNLTNAGAITITGVDNATGVLILGGNTGSFTNATTGVITINESYAASDTVNSDGVVEAPFATGAGRFGVRILGPGAFNGTINMQGSVAVQGNNSYGVSIETPVIGAVTLGGVSLTGDNGIGVNIAAPITGNVALGGGVTVQGQNTAAVLVNSDITGSLSINSANSATGYTLTTRVTDPTALAKIEATPTDVEQGGPGISIAANVTGGVYMSGAPVGTIAGSTADLDLDGVADGSETTGSVVSYGGSPGLQIGAAGKTIALGAFGTGDNAYGLLLRGSVSALGVFDNVPTTAVQIGLPGGAVNIAGGARFVSTISAFGYNADSTALHIGAGSTVPEIRIDAGGELSGSIGASTSAVTAYGLQIDSGAKVSTITNSGTITAVAIGDAASATAVVDRSGTVTRVLNQGAILPTLTPTTAGDVLTGRAIALDLSANTTGVTLIQQVNPNPNTVYGSTAGTADTATSTNTAVTPSIQGDVILGSGVNSVQLLGGTMTGALNMGSGTGSIVVDNGATFYGQIAHVGTLSLAIGTGTLQNTSTTPLTLTSLSLGSGAVLGLAVDPANNAATRYTVTGPASIASGAQLSVTLNSLLTTPQTYTIISSPQLSGAGDTTVAANVPYLFNASVATNLAAGTVSLSLRKRTNAELGLNGSEAAAADAIYGVLPNDAAVQTAVLQQTNYAGLAAIYDQMLPEHSGGSFLGAQAASEAISRAAAEPDVAEAGGMWASEIAYGMEQSKGVDSAYRASGFGIVGGLEADSNIGAVGLTAAFVTGNTADQTLPGNNYFTVTQVEIGAYWRKQFRNLVFDASGSAGYASFKSNRELIVAANDITAALDRNATSTWSGYSLSGRFGVAYEMKSGRFYFRPQAHADYFRLEEGSHSENNGGAGFDLIYNQRTGDALTATASIVAGMTFGSQVKWRPQIEIGYRDVLSGTAGDTTANFAGGSPFTLAANPITGGGAVARISLVAEADYLKLILEAGAQMNKKVRAGDVRATVRMRF